MTSSQPQNLRNDDETLTARDPLPDRRGVVGPAEAQHRHPRFWRTIEENLVDSRVKWVSNLVLALRADAEIGGDEAIMETITSAGHGPRGTSRCL